ncbi:MAG: glycosyltransferase family 4 protein [Candidatus Aminicenantes bacterium]|nr:glycosyltransferase family 4 protein [Candidatus Aminicenantes bacterium]
MNKLIFHIDDSRNLRGGERQVLYLASELEKHDCKNVIVCRPNSPLEKEALKLGIETDHIPFHFEWDLRAAYLLSRKVKKAARKFDIQAPPILHSHTGHAAAAVWLTRRFVKAVTIAHRRVDFKVPNKPLSRRKYRSADLIIALSKAIEQILIDSGIDGAKIRVIPSAVDLAAFSGKPDRAFREHLLRDLNIPADAILIGSLMALVPHKDPLSLVAAAGQVIQADKRCHFIVGGEGPLLEDIQALTAKLGITSHFHLLGYREDNVNLLRAMDIFVLASREEGLGSALIEAMACGLPVVGTDAGGIPELIENERNGFVVPKQNPAALGQAILQLAGDAGLREAFARRSLELSRKYSSLKMAAKTLLVYEEASRAAQKHF